MLLSNAMYTFRIEDGRHQQRVRAFSDEEHLEAESRPPWKVEFPLPVEDERRPEPDPREASWTDTRRSQR